MSTLIKGSPFANGEAAHAKGKTIHDSPYSRGSRERTRWINGWQSAADKAQREAIEARPLDAWAAQEATSDTHV